GHRDNDVDVRTVVILNQQRNVGYLRLGVRPADLQVDSLLNALLLEAVEEALHAHVGAFLRREIHQADLVLHDRAARRASARSERGSRQKGECSSPCRTHTARFYRRISCTPTPSDHRAQKDPTLPARVQQTVSKDCTRRSLLTNNRVSR